jgi:maltose alpha-D-glucosyltransferase/alpha-amylase
MARISVARTRRELELIFAFLMTMPGAPLIYYGDEIGMKYRKGLVSKEGGYARTGSRTPMQWSRGRNAGFSTAPSSKLYLPVDTGTRFPNVESQERDPKSLLNTVRRLIALRKQTPCLCGDGAFDVLYAKACKYPFVYLRRHRRQKVLVALNPSKEPVCVGFTLKGAEGPGKLLLGRGAALTATKTRYRVDMKGVSYGIFQV